jgi:hypothetical protein
MLMLNISDDFVAATNQQYYLRQSNSLELVLYVKVAKCAMSAGSNCVYHGVIDGEVMIGTGDFCSKLSHPQSAQSHSLSV